VAVKHDEEKHQFYIDTPDGKATLNYEREGEKLNFHHVFVPDALRGQGLAKQVVIAGFEYVEKNNLKAIPSCPYVSGFIARNPAYKRLVVTS